MPGLLSRPLWAKAPTPQVEQPPAPSPKSLAERILAGRKARIELREHTAEGHRRDAELEQLKADHAAYCEQHRQKSFDLNSTANDGDAAESSFRSGVKLPPEVDQLHNQGFVHQKEAMQLSVRYALHASVVPDPAHSEEGKRLEQVIRDIDSCEEAIRRFYAANPTANPAGCSAEHLLPRLRTEQRDLQRVVEQQTTQFEHWKEIQAEKRAAEECFAKRDQLKTEAQEAALEKLLKGK